MSARISFFSVTWRLWTLQIVVKLFGLFRRQFNTRKKLITILFMSGSYLLPKYSKITNDKVYVSSLMFRAMSNLCFIWSNMIICLNSFQIRTFKFFKLTGHFSSGTNLMYQLNACYRKRWKIQSFWTVYHWLLNTFS